VEAEEDTVPEAMEPVGGRVVGVNDSIVLMFLSLSRFVS